MTADELSEAATESSVLASWRLEHPFMAHANHEAAASAHELLSAGQTAEAQRHKRLAIEHRKAAEYWAGKEARYK